MEDNTMCEKWFVPGMMNGRTLPIHGLNKWSISHQTFPTKREETELLKKLFSQHPPLT